MGKLGPGLPSSALASKYLMKVWVTAVRLCVWSVAVGWHSSELKLFAGVDSDIEVRNSLASARIETRNARSHFSVFHAPGPYGTFGKVAEAVVAGNQPILKLAEFQC